MVHGDDRSRMVVVPVHGRRDLKPGTMRAILHAAQLTPEAFRALL